LKKNKIWTSILVFFVILFLLISCFYFISVRNKKEVTQTEDILDYQYELEESYMEDYELNNYTLDNPKVILDPYNMSPLTAIVMFKTDESEVVTVTVEGKDDKTTIINTFDTDTDHILPIYGLYAGTDNTVIISIGNITKEITITTEALPDDFILPTYVYADKEQVSDDLIFVSTAAAGNAAAYDVNGDVRWYLEGNYSWDIQRLDNGHLMLSSNRQINYPYYTVGLVELDLTGKIYKEYTLPGGYHHDVYEMPNGDLLVASDDFSRGTVEDYVVLLSRETGEIIKTWDIASVLPEDEGISENWTETDWFHNNAVWYDESTDSITLSGRHLDAVINIDYNTGDLNWIIGDSTNWGEEMQQYFFTPVGDNFEWQWSQHAAMVLPDGDIFIFDNGNNRSKIEEDYISANDNYSRGVIYNINTDDMTIEQVWEYGKERGNEFYSPYISDVDYLGENHYLVHSGGIGTLDGESLNQPGVSIEGAELNSITVEVLDDEVIFELQLPSNYYRAEKLSLYSDNNLVFGKGERLGTLGETSTDDEYTNVIFSSKSIPEEYGLTINKETDRLTLNGTFTKGSYIYLILDNTFNQKVYKIYVSKTPYTAMCIGIFDNDSEDTDEKININYYINEENLSGRYNVYLKVDDKVYNTNEYVVFE